MPDVAKPSKQRDPAVTSKMMAQVRNKDSKAEIAVRKRLFAMGLRFRVQYTLFGKPDIAFPSQRIAIFIDGDFWHGNAWRLRGLTQLADLFPNRTEWWVAKITRTMARDMEVTTRLERDGWRVLRYWESDVLADPDLVASSIAAVVRES